MIAKSTLLLRWLEFEINEKDNFHMYRVFWNPDGWLLSAHFVLIVELRKNILIKLSYLLLCIMLCFICLFMCPAFAHNGRYPSYSKEFKTYKLMETHDQNKSWVGFTTEEIVLLEDNCGFN